MMKIHVVEEFTDRPGPRYVYEGKFSGEEFREKFLIPKFTAAMELGEKIELDLDGGYGYGTSFLEESFGGLARIFEPQVVLNNIILISEDDDSLSERIRNYIIEARKTIEER